MKERFLEEFANAAHKIAKAGLVTCSSGNLSWKIDKEILLITSTGSWMEKLSKDQIAVCRIDDGKPLNNIKPSVEIGFHAGILRTRKDINMVLHFQSPYATAVACIDPSFDNFNVIPEIPYYIGSVKRIPFYPPGSRDLADAVTEAAKFCNMIIMQNHGLVTMAPDLNLLLKRALFFEFACKILFIGGKRIKGLSEDQIKKIEV